MMKTMRKALPHLAYPALGFGNVTNAELWRPVLGTRTWTSIEQEDRAFAWLLYALRNA